MKFCAVICEFNPFHNGHAYFLEEVKKQSGCDALLCIMSGNFTQRGDMAVLNKYRRATHAILSGADVVVELPTCFATSPAELFAKGAAGIIKSCPSVTTLAFGCEDDDKQKFIDTAKALSTETKEFKSILKSKLATGESFVKARLDTLKQLGVEGLHEELLDSPNNILGVEYTKALLGSDVDILPIKRIGAGFADNLLYKQLSSASAIRKAVISGDVKGVKKNVPKHVLCDLPFKKQNHFKNMVLYSLLTRTAEEIAQFSDCAEGLENKFKAILKSNFDYDTVIEKVTSRRYTTARIKRIALATFLNIKRQDVLNFLTDSTYIKILAIKRDRFDELLTELSKSSYPLLTRKTDVRKLSKLGEQCFDLDVHANDIYDLITGEDTNEFAMKII